MKYDVVFQRLVHEGGTKEYRVFWFARTGTSIGHTVKLWGKVGRMSGKSVERDDSRVKFEKILREKKAKGYSSVGGKCQRDVIVLTHAYIERDHDFGLAEAWLEYQEAFKRAGLSVGSAPDLETTARTETITKDLALGVAASGPGTAKTFGKLTPPPETVTESNPTYGMF